jgi:hypothetical protein
MQTSKFVALALIALLICNLPHFKTLYQLQTLPNFELVVKIAWVILLLFPS